MGKPTPFLLVLGVPVFVLLLGFSTATWIAVKQIPSLLEETGRGVLPDGFEVVLPDTGDYTLWLHEEGRFGNEIYQGAGEVPPGGKIYLFESASGREIELKEQVSAEKNLGEDRAVSLGVFTCEREGKTIEVKGTGLNSKLLLSISHSSSRQIVSIVLVVAGIVLGTLILATILFIQLVRRKVASLSE